MIRFVVPANVNILVLDEPPNIGPDEVKVLATLLVEQEINSLGVVEGKDFKNIGKVGVRIHINPITSKK